VPSLLTWVPATPEVELVDLNAAAWELAVNARGGQRAGAG
jgi:hypothetical protein